MEVAPAVRSRVVAALQGHLAVEDRGAPAPVEDVLDGLALGDWAQLPALRLEVRAPEYLPYVRSLIHDCWFAVTSITEDHDRHRLTIPFDRPSDQWQASGWPLPAPSWVACAMVIHGVTSHVAEDTQGIGRYDFDEVRYAGDSGVLHLETCIPMAFRVTVTHLHVEVLLSRPPAPEIQRDAGTIERLPLWVRVRRAIRAHLQRRPLPGQAADDRAQRPPRADGARVRALGPDNETAQSGTEEVERE
jgi:hypothetical protein